MTTTPPTTTTPTTAAELGSSVTNPRERESVRELRRSVREEFPEPEHVQLIDLYLSELSFLMDPPPVEGASGETARHEATSGATDEDAVTVGQQIVEVLEQHGLDTVWDETASDRILVLLNWQRRYAPRASTAVPTT